MYILYYESLLLKIWGLHLLFVLYKNVFIPNLLYVVVFYVYNPSEVWLNKAVGK